MPKGQAQSEAREQTIGSPQRTAAEEPSLPQLFEPSYVLWSTIELYSQEHPGPLWNLIRILIYWHLARFSLINQEIKQNLNFQRIRKREKCVWTMSNTCLLGPHELKFCDTNTWVKDLIIGQIFAFPEANTKKIPK